MGFHNKLPRLEFADQSTLYKVSCQPKMFEIIIEKTQ